MSTTPSRIVVRVLDANVKFVEQKFTTPLLLSTGPIEQITEAVAEVRVRVEGTGGTEATGRGSIYLSDLWAWPLQSMTHDERDAVLRRRCDDIVEKIVGWLEGKPAHPLELGLRLHEKVCDPIFDDPDPTTLAKAMCLSPFDAAIHDAVGIAMGCSAFALYEHDEPIESADSYFTQGTTQAIRAMLRRTPVTTSPAWLIVGKNSDLEKDVRPWACDQGYHCFKLKIAGKDNADDVQQTIAIYRAAVSWGCGKDIRLSLDSNEGNPNADSVVDYLNQLKSADADAFAALEYLEQPTGRDVLEHRYDWQTVHAIKPVLLDEGLTSLPLLAEAKSQGWSGLALKTCKGHSFALAAAAWAHEQNMTMTLQDLTNPGLSMIHAALFAAWVPTLNGVELNSPQYTPAANAAFLPRLTGLFQPTAGQHVLPNPHTPGLGSQL